MSGPKNCRLQNPEVVKFAPKDLILAPRNARIHSEEQIEQLAASIREFGFTVPVLIDEKKQLIAGHGRLAAALKVGLEEIPCIQLSGLTDRQKRAYILADNKLALNSDWNETLLAMELQKLKDEEFDVTLTGFSDAELDALFEDLKPEESEGEEGEIPQAIQMEPPREYVVVMCESPEDWEALKVALELTPVRRGGYKKGSPFQAVGTQRVVIAKQLLARLNKC